MATVAVSALDSPLLKFPMALMYTFGFVCVILGHSELFTEHTTLAVLPVLSGDRSLVDLPRLWEIVWSGKVENRKGTARTTQEYEATPRNRSERVIARSTVPQFSVSVYE